MSDDDADDANLPTLLKRTPSGSLFIPSGLTLIHSNSIRVEFSHGS